MFLDGARTGADLVVGGVNDGWQVAMGTLRTERVLTTLPMQLGFPFELQTLIGAVRAGAARGDHPRQALVKAWIGLRVDQLTTAPGGNPPRPDPGARVAGEAALGQLARPALAMDVAGRRRDGRSRRRRTRAPPACSSSRAETIYGGANEIQRNVVGERILGLPREPG